MTVTDQRSPTSAPFAASTPPPPGRLRVRRQPKWIAAGAIALCLGGLGATVAFGQATQSTEVIVLTRTVARGEVVAATDLRTTRVGTLTGVSFTPADRLDTIVGQHALVDLSEGALLPAGAVGTPALDPGSAQLGLRLAPGRLPTAELPAGTPVLLVPLADDRTGAEPAAAAPPPPIPATVLVPARPGPDGVALLLDVRVEAHRAAEVATLAAADRLALVREGL